MSMSLRAPLVECREAVYRDQGEAISALQAYLRNHMHIFLYGPSGAGKSTVGKALAQHLNLSFVDSDQMIEINTGISIPEIMETQGEPGLRYFETAVLRQIVEEKESVVALGGGALLREENRALVENSGNVFLLMAELPTLLERLQKDEHKRPLLRGD